MKHVTTLFGQNAESLNLRVGGTYTNHCEFKHYISKTCYFLKELVVSRYILKSRKN
jgi:hypothetical protein